VLFDIKTKDLNCTLRKSDGNVVYKTHSQVFIGK